MKKYEKIIKNLQELDRRSYLRFKEKLQSEPGSDRWKELEDIENEYTEQIEQEFAAFDKTIDWYSKRAKTEEEIAHVEELRAIYTKLYDCLVCDLTEEEINEMADEAVKVILEATDMNITESENELQKESNKVLARKGKYILVKYECGLYAVKISTKSVGMRVFTSNDKEEAIKHFASLKAKRTEYDFDLETSEATEETLESNCTDTEKLMIFPGRCPLNKDNCKGCEQYEVCIEFYKIGYEPRLKIEESAALCNYSATEAAPLNEENEAREGKETMLNIEIVKDLYQDDIKDYAEEFIKNGYVGARYCLGRIHAYSMVLDYKSVDVEKDIENAIKEAQEDIENSVAPEDAEPVEADATPETIQDAPEEPIAEDTETNETRIKQGDFIETPRFLKVRIDKVLTRQEAREQGFNTGTDYKSYDFDIYGKSTGRDLMSFAAVMK